MTPPAPVEPQLVNVGSVQRVQGSPPPDLLASVFPARTAEAAPADKQEAPRLIGVWVVIAAFALIATLVFHLPLVFAVLVTVLLGRWVRKPAVLSMIQRFVDTWGNREFRPPQS